jgi:ubiquinone/menaquinone biosynthesis C-methylase UbiE
VPLLTGKLGRRFPHLRPALVTELLALIKDMTARRTKQHDAVMDDVANFGARTRDAWVAQIAASLKPGSRVLDAGAGECRYRELFAHCVYQSQDSAQYVGTAAGVLAETWSYGRLDYVCDITKIPADDASFDAVLCTEVLEHVPRPIEALKELSRILVPGGGLYLSAPLGSGLHQQPHHYYGGYTPHFYQTFMPECGLELRELRPTGGLMRNVAQETYRAGRVLAEKAPQELTPLARFLLTDWLPRYLAKYDARICVEEFTLGYLVEAVKVR